MKSRGKIIGGSSAPRLRAPIVVTTLTQKVLGKMMTSEPISCAELVAAIPDSSTDAVQSIIDVLVILGCTVSLKRPLIEPGQAPITVYTLVGFMRSPEPLDVAEFEKIIEIKEKNTQATRKRIEELRVSFICLLRILLSITINNCYLSLVLVIYL